MTSFYLTVLRFVRAFLLGLKDAEFRALLLTLLGLLVSGTLFYREAEGWSALDALYFSVMTLVTVGAGDLHPSTPLSKIFTMLYVVIGVGVFFSFLIKLNRLGRSRGSWRSGDPEA